VVQSGVDELDKSEDVTGSVGGEERDDPVSKRPRPSPDKEDRQSRKEEDPENDGDGNGEDDGEGREEEEVSSPTSGDANQLPRATVAKLIQELLPAGIACPRETRELIQRCCVEFIHLVTGEANDICERKHKRTITPEHVVEALHALGFGDYVEDAQAAAEHVQQQHREKRTVRDRSRDLQERSGLTEAQLLQQQEELFQAARQRYLSTASASMAPAPSQEAADVLDKVSK
jgi:histone H3/H4